MLTGMGNAWHELLQIFTRKVLLPYVVWNGGVTLYVFTTHVRVHLLPLFICIMHFSQAQEEAKKLLAGL